MIIMGRVGYTPPPSACTGTKREKKKEKVGGPATGGSDRVACAVSPERWARGGVCGVGAVSHEYIAPQNNTHTEHTTRQNFIEKP